MALSVITLDDLLNKSDYKEEEIKQLLFSFETISLKYAPGSEDVQYFLHNKAIEFEKIGISRTTLIMSTYKGKSFLAGYFSVSPKPLVINKKNFGKLSGSLKRRLMGVGHKTDQDNYQIPSILIGQLGKNYSDISQKAKSLNGNELLQLAYEKVKDIHKLIGGRIVYLECENFGKIKDFYLYNGFREIEELRSKDELCIFIKDIKKL
ncbi:MULTISPECIES: GNAT family acetyltransferase [unclassified Oceanobacillus]|uniref:GNAT family acetyltransferase n=1 Tax=unclassified Oceanobacillus TaxID=2630292 RepID=UPI001BE640B9|nr:MULTISPECIES: GNAT family acetyltransferase [unclassified Oceanobacillus]MBT2601438.1 GNAT family acetyltransferase [Oceanobacillus sp. ISL-74]MBT2653285.1 GNAT family acetyltransferase [Oceanobacillus sp. ISL-73]